MKKTVALGFLVLILLFSTACGAFKVPHFLSVVDVISGKELSLYDKRNLFDRNLGKGDYNAAQDSYGYAKFMGTYTVEVSFDYDDRAKKIEIRTDSIRGGQFKFKDISKDLTLEDMESGFTAVTYPAEEEGDSFYCRYYDGKGNIVEKNGADYAAMVHFNDRGDVVSLSIFPQFVESPPTPANR